MFWFPYTIYMLHAGRPRRRDNARFHLPYPQSYVPHLPQPSGGRDASTRAIRRRISPARTLVPTFSSLSAAVSHHLIPSQNSHEVHFLTPVNSHFSLPSLSVQHSFSSAPLNQKKLSPFTGPPLYSGLRSPRCGWMSGCHCARNVIAKTSPFVSEKPLDRFPPRRRGRSAEGKGRRIRTPHEPAAPGGEDEG